MKLTNKQADKVRDIALAEYPNEAVMYISSKGIVKQLKNISQTPITDFEIDSKLLPDDAKCLIHSHTQLETPLAERDLFIDGRTPSELDMHTQSLLDIPFGICLVDKYKEYFEPIFFPDLEGDIFGQTYFSGLSDCYETVRKYYYQNYKITLKPIPRSVDWWKTNPSLMVDSFESVGFHEIQLKDIQIGDVVLLKIMGHSIPATHAAVYTADDTILHQMTNRFPEETQLSKYMTRLDKVLRYQGNV